VRTLATVLKIALLAPAYGLVLALAWLLRRPGRAVTTLGALGLAAVVWQLSGCHRPLRVGTFNIRQFGEAKTDMEKLASLVVSLDTDILAIQEVQSETKLRELAGRISRGGRAYRVALSRCGGKSAMQLGYLYDEDRVKLLSTREYPELDPAGGGQCDSGERPGLLGVFSDGSRTLHVLTMHLTPGGERGDFAKRKAQWRRAHAIVRQLRAEGATSVVLVGDANSAGYLTDDNGERSFLDGAARDAGMSVVTSSLRCSEYWREKEGLYSPSLLDHAVASPGLVEAESVRVHGFCAALRCASSPTPPDDFDSISDHCPVTFDLR
jgi:endonuclease/exonuclease/phosphatase family metal-dependent hydrolase